MFHTITEKNKMINFIKSYGYSVVEHHNGNYSVTDPSDDNDGWRIIDSQTALEETVEMIVNNLVND